MPDPQSRHCPDFVAAYEFGKLPETEVTRRARFGRDRAKSGHNSDIAEVKRLTRSENPPSLFDQLLPNRCSNTTLDSMASADFYCNNTQAQEQ